MKTRNDLFVQVWNLFITFELKVSTQGERHNLFMLASSSGPYLMRHPWRANSSRLSEPAKVDRLHPLSNLNSLTFFQFSTNLCMLLMRDVTRTPSPVSSWTIVTSLSDTFVRPRAPTLTPASSLHLTHVLSRKVLSLTKPKGMNRNPSAITLQL